MLVAAAIGRKEKRDTIHIEKFVVNNRFPTGEKKIHKKENHTDRRMSGFTAVTFPFNSFLVHKKKDFL